VAQGGAGHLGRRRRRWRFRHPLRRKILNEALDDEYSILLVVAAPLCSTNQFGRDIARLLKAHREAETIKLTPQISPTVGPHTAP
jgi:hypothetical protein